MQFITELIKLLIIFQVKFFANPDIAHHLFTIRFAFDYKLRNLVAKHNKQHEYNFEKKQNKKNKKEENISVGILKISADYNLVEVCFSQ